jgi:HPt (histidine-containing phosphotransfer) domain-containing protein
MSQNQTAEERIAAARARLADLGEKFLERTRDELRTLRGSFESLNACERDALDVIAQLAHRMAGTAGTLGLETLGERARDIEKLCEAQPPGALSGAALASLGSAIDALAAELESTPRAG